MIYEISKGYINKYGKMLKLMERLILIVCNDLDLGDLIREVFVVDGDLLYLVE